MRTCVPGKSTGLAGKSAPAPGKPYGGIAREDRIGPFCDKAWHMPQRAKAIKVLTCSWCGRAYARCAECQRSHPVENSMRGHLGTHHGGAPRREPDARTGIASEYKRRIAAPMSGSGPSPYDDRDVRLGRAPEELGEDEWLRRHER